ncbi:MAG: Rieske (2Fe-2S) protein [Acidobacteria bacterium]|nr:Rieske (2Fe-2S) protein [Acidobacteriota bacterium]
MSDPDSPASNPLSARPAWEVDFPYDRVEAQHVSRREFAKFLVVVSGGLTAGSGWVAVKDSVLPEAPRVTDVRLCSLSEIPGNGMKAFALPGSGEPAILIRLGDGALRAYEQKCTHLSCAVFYDALSSRIECPCHRGAFDPATGAVLAGPPPRPLRSYPVEVRGDDVWLVADRPEGQKASS